MMILKRTIFLTLIMLFFSATQGVNVNGLEIINSPPSESLARSPNDPDDASIVSESRNFTVYTNQTVHLPCLVRQTPNTIVVWNQCEDPACIHLRNPLTINKDNFIQDLRFRVLSELPSTTFPQGGSEFGELTDTPESSDSSSSITVKRDQEAVVSTAEKPSDLVAWNLEIRRFSKLDEACYHCQLNSEQTKFIYYCLKLQTRVITRSKKLTVRVNQPIRLKCSTDENVRLSNVKWFRNGHRIMDEANLNELLIEKKVHHDHIYSTLLIKHASPNDAGIYMCKFGQIGEKIHVEVVLGDEKIKSAEIRSNQDDESDVVPSISQSISDAVFSPSSRATLSQILTSLSVSLGLLIIIFV